MKYGELARMLRRNGWYLKREGRRHEIWTNGLAVEQVPRHKDINEELAKMIIKRCGLK